VVMPVNLRRPGLDSSGSFSKAESYLCASPADMEVTNRSQFRQPIWRTTVSRGRWRCCALALTATPGLLAQSAGPNDVELRKEAQNPIANLISVPFQNNTNFPVGRYARGQDVFGPTFLLPTATERTLSQGKWGAGPSFVALLQPEHWTIGFLTNNIWSYAGDKVRPPVNQGLLQYFVNYNMDKGWYMGIQPIITADWRANATLGKQPINAHLGTYYDLIHPRDLPYGKWQVRMQAALLFPKAK
jgi:hypothetical protein